MLIADLHSEVSSLIVVQFEHNLMALTVHLDLGNEDGALFFAILLALQHLLRFFAFFCAFFALFWLY